MTAQPTKAEKKAFWRELHQRHPGVRQAIAEDVRVTSLHRGEGSQELSGLKLFFRAIQLAWVTDAFFALACYRLRMRMKARGIPVLPTVLHKLSMASAQVSIGDPVHLAPGMYFPHGQMVIDGLVHIQGDTVIAPWVSIGLVSGNHKGPDIGTHCFIGSGAKLLGPMNIGNGVKVGAGSVVTRDVPDGATVVGIPAKEVGNK